jgi:hypothetical protein
VCSSSGPSLKRHESYHLETGKNVRQVTFCGGERGATVIWPTGGHPLRGGLAPDFSALFIAQTDSSAFFRISIDSAIK